MLNKLFYGLLWLLTRLIALIPTVCLQYLGQFIGFILWVTPNDQKRVARLNIKHCYPNYTTQEIDKLVKAALAHTGMNMMESIGFMGKSPKSITKLIKKSYGQKAVEEAYKAKKGIIFLSPHLASWDLIALYSTIYFKSTILYRPPKLTAIEPLLVNARSATGGILVPTTPIGIKKLLKALLKKECIGILPDQDPGENGGIFAPFFKQPAWTMTLALRYWQKTKSPVFLGFSERLGPGKGFNAHYIPLDLSGVDETDMKALATAMNKGIESCIEKNPEQYLWVYKRFKRVPYEGMNIYDKRLK